MNNTYELYELWHEGCEELETHIEVTDNTDCIPFEEV